MRGPTLDPLFADADVTTKVGRYVIYVLAVAGGFLVGNILTLILPRCPRLMFSGGCTNSSNGRIIGGTVAILVAYLLPLRHRLGTRRDRQREGEVGRPTLNDGTGKTSSRPRGRFKTGGSGVSRRGESRSSRSDTQVLLGDGETEALNSRSRKKSSASAEVPGRLKLSTSSSKESRPSKHW